MRTVRHLELERCMGQWYEIACCDRLFGRPLHDVETRCILRPDGAVEIERAGTDSRTGRRRISRACARPTHRNGQLRMRSLIFFHTDCRILELDDRYEWMLVGRSFPLQLHILSRQPRMRRDTLRHIVELAERRGYPFGRLRLLQTPQ